MSDSARSRTLQFGLISTALLPFLLSIGFHAAGASAHAPAPGPRRPSLAFEQYMVNLGPVPPRRFVPARFTFRNTGTQPVHIAELQPSCGCLTPRLAKRDYGPGEAGEFFLQIETPGETPGPKEYTVTVRYTDSQPREERLTFRVELPERQVVVEPRALVFYQLSNCATTQNVLVTDFRRQPLSITSVSSDSKLVTARVAGEAQDAEGNRQHWILIRVDGKVPDGRTRALVKLHTDDAEYRELLVPLIVEGRHGRDAKLDAVTICPPSLRIPRSGPRPPLHTIVIADSREKPLTPTAVTTASPLVRAKIGASEITADGHRRFEIEVIVGGDLLNEPINDVVSIVTDDPEHRKIDVPIVIGDAHETRVSGLASERVQVSSGLRE